jgi:hypothetical protein
VTTPPTSAPARSRPLGPLVLAVLAGLAHLAIGPLYAAAGLLAPGWAVVVLALWWGLLAAVLVHLARRRSWWTPAVPVVALATWWLVLTAGERLLGWTA